MTTTEILRLVLLASSVAGIVVCFVAAMRFADKWLYTIPPLLLAINMAIFTATRLALASPLPPDLALIYNLWGYVVMLQLAFTILGGGIVFLWTKK